MTNFFNISSNNDNIFSQQTGEDNTYKQIFIEAANIIRKETDKFKPDNPCNTCNLTGCNIQKKDIFADYPYGCKYQEWQAKVLSFFNAEYKQKLKNSYKLIMKEKEKYECNQCGDCCRLAVSEFSYNQLRQKANQGNKFAQDFVSVYVPYVTEDEAEKANPGYFKALNETLYDTKIYYYYCPKLKDNLCSDYDNRPGMCRDFPHNPLKLLPQKCSFNEWTNEVNKKALLLKAKTDIIAFYKERLG